MIASTPAEICSVGEGCRRRGSEATVDLNFGVSGDAVASQESDSSSPMQSNSQKQQNLTIRQTDEIRIVSAVAHAATQNQGHNTLGSIFSVKVDLSLTPTHTLCIGVKDLPHNLLCVSMLKRVDANKGPGELAGIKLGDIIFGGSFEISILSCVFLKILSVLQE